jgi:hypothetical protein
MACASVPQRRKSTWRKLETASRQHLLSLSWPSTKIPRIVFPAIVAAVAFSAAAVVASAFLGHLKLATAAVAGGGDALSYASFNETLLDTSPPAAVFRQPGRTNQTVTERTAVGQPCKPLWQGPPELHRVPLHKLPTRRLAIDERVRARHTDALAVADAAIAVCRGVPVPVLVANFSLPRHVVGTLPDRVQVALLRRLVFLRALRPHIDARILIIHVQNGLGNRLRAMTGGIALAKVTGRVPVVVWERDAHLNASFRDLFVNEEECSAGVGGEPDGCGATEGKMRTVGVAFADHYVDNVAGLSNGQVGRMEKSSEEFLYKQFIVLDRFLPWDAVSSASDSWFPVNKMYKETAGGPNGPKPASSIGLVFQDRLSRSARKDVISSRHHVYLKSAYVPITNPQDILVQGAFDPLLRRLIPSPAVQRIVGSSMPLNIHLAIGVHVRSRSVTNDNVQVDSLREYSQRGVDITNFWRSQSHAGAFVSKMKRDVNRNPDVHFFVATDDYRATAQLEKDFPGRIAHIRRTCDDRSPACVQYALADLMCLGRTRKLVGSNWSSFTEVAGRLGGVSVYRSGVHFAKSKPRHAVGD